MRLIIFSLIFFYSLPLKSQQRIIYLSNLENNFDIYAQVNEEQAPQRLTQNPAWDWNPQWIPGLQAILYYSNDTARNFSVRLMKADGTSIPFDGRGMEEFILSPDGQKVLYTISEEEYKHIAILWLKDLSKKVLVKTSSYNGRAVWAPDSKKFSFLSDRDGNTELYLYHLKSGESKRLTQSEKREKYASWHPDGEHIFYTYHYSDERDKEHNDIFSVDIKNGNIRQITDDPKFYQEIAVSPDGKKIAFHGRREGKDHIFIMDIDGKNEVQLTRADAYHGEPAWIPAGQ